VGIDRLGVATAAEITRHFTRDRYVGRWPTGLRTLCLSRSRLRRCGMPDNVRELDGLWHHTPVTEAVARGIVGNLWVIGGCSGTRVCASQTACGRQRPALLDACFGARRFRMPCYWARTVHKRQADGDNVRLGARWVLARPGLVSTRWTFKPATCGFDLHRWDWWRPAGPARTGHRNLLISGSLGLVSAVWHSWNSLD
jgi:hypothetical protein